MCCNRLAIFIFYSIIMVNVVWTIDVRNWELIESFSWEWYGEWKVNLYRMKGNPESKNERHILEFETSYDLFDPETLKKIGNRQQVGIQGWMEISSILRGWWLLSEKMGYWSTYPKNSDNLK